MLCSSHHRSLSLCLFSPSKKPLISQHALIPDRRRGFSNRMTAVMFVATVVNFILYSLSTGSDVAGFIVFIRKALILDLDYPLSEKPELVNNALRNMNLLTLWATNFPVSIKLSPSAPVSIYARWRYYSAISSSFGGLGPSSQIDSG